jgi:hypothetical protein
MMVNCFICFFRIATTVDQDVQLSYDTNLWIDSLKSKFHTQPSQNNSLTMHQGIIRLKGRICVGQSDN